jgi:predicted metal-dependent phosphoesterase TrpH
MRERIAFDAHVHTDASGDSACSLNEIFNLVVQRQIEGRPLGVAITDHNTIVEELENICKQAEVPIIIGEEIKTSDRNDKGRRIEIGALGLRSPIEQGLMASETIFQIHDQRGMVVLVHPFDEWRHGAGDEWSRWIINVCLDGNIPVAVEVCNARASRGSNRKAEELWEEFKEKGVLRTAGSDAHWKGEIGRAHVVVPFFRTKEEFLEVMVEAEIEGRGNIYATAFHRSINRALLLSHYRR